MNEVQNDMQQAGTALIDARHPAFTLSEDRDIDALSERIRELETALHRRDEFLAILAHELRNPLGPIRNVAQIVRTLAASDDRLAKASDILERQVAHMSRLVDDLFDTARLRWGRLALKTELVDAAAILSSAVEAMQPRFASRNQALTMKLPHDVLLVHADSIRLTQVFCNLLDNATNYTPDRGQVEVEALLDGDAAVIRIADNGSGIPESMLTSIFELFTQVQPTPHETRCGLGLGLPLVKKLVEMHHGSIEARSQGPGRGSEFVIRLPLVRQSPFPRLVDAQHVAPRG
jgi:signal transduction histidine kinase